MLHVRQVLNQLDRLEQELQELRARVAAGFPTDDLDETELFLRKCGGWQDQRSPDEIVAELYTSRTSSLRGVCQPGQGTKVMRVTFK